MRSKFTTFHIIGIVGLLLIGVTVYYFFRQSYTLYEQWLGITKYSVPMALANWLPDFCWCCALLLTMKLIWHDWRKVPFTWKLCCWILPIGSEYFQWLQIIPGTADVWDVFVYLITYLLIESNFFMSIQKNAIKYPKSVM